MSATTNPPTDSNIQRSRLESGVVQPHKRLHRDQGVVGVVRKERTTGSIPSRRLTDSKVIKGVAKESNQGRPLERWRSRYDSLVPRIPIGIRTRSRYPGITAGPAYPSRENDQPWNVVHSRTVVGRVNPQLALMSVAPRGSRLR